MTLISRFTTRAISPLPLAVYSHGLTKSNNFPYRFASLVCSPHQSLYINIMSVNSSVPLPYSFSSTRVSPQCRSDRSITIKPVNSSYRAYAEALWAELVSKIKYNR